MRIDGRTKSFRLSGTPLALSSPIAGLFQNRRKVVPSHPPPVPAV
jgi:hypothetical protein